MRKPRLSATVVSCAAGILFLVAVLSINLSCTDVVVHLINARTGSPIPAKRIRMWSRTPARGWTGYLEQATDSNGVAIFHLKDPSPDGIVVHTAMGGYWEECLPNDRLGFDVSDIVRSGVAREGACPPNLRRIDDKYSPKPGDLYIFVSHLTLWERITHCGEWGCR